MSDDYLWDGSGEPDPETARLLALLRPLRYDRPAPAFPAATPAHGFLGGRLGSLAAAAALAFALTGTWQALGPSRRTWEVTRLEGPVGNGVLESTRLHVGEWLETDASTRARIKVGLIGQVEIEPRTRLRLVDAGVSSHRLSLVQGVMHARIWARPGQFLVDTPSATAVDLGCIYTLEVDDTGTGLLTVASGWVAFAFEGRESFVPRGARCITRPRSGPGTPYFLDASPALRSALDRLDLDAEREHEQALATVIAEARPRDALSLWHLLARVGAEDRERVYARFAALVPPPEGVTREGILRLDRGMLDRWWDALDLGDVTWWRGWERPWTPSSPAR